MYAVKAGIVEQAWFFQDKDFSHPPYDGWLFYFIFDLWIFSSMVNVSLLINQYSRH
jgi:hypothetical protein